MPPTAASLRVGRYFLSLFVIFAALYGLVFIPGRTHTPKLGLDLKGGAQVVFRAQVPGGGPPSQASMKVARQIMTDRVNGAGVSSAEVVQQGSDRIVVSVPGARADKLSGVGSAAALSFRPVVMPAVGGAATGTATPAPTSGGTGGTGGATVKPSATATANRAKSTPAKPAPSKPATKRPTAPSTSANGIAQPRAAAPTSTAPKAAATSAPPSAAATKPAADPFQALGFPLPKSEAEYDALPPARQQALRSALSQFDCNSKPADIAAQPLPSCGTANGLKYLLGPVIVPGREIKSASAVAPAGQQPEWTVSISLKGSGQRAWANYTNAHHSASNSVGPDQCAASTTPCAEFVAFTLDGKVVSSPHNEATINGDTSVSGSFTSRTANSLANQLKYGALPLSFTQETASDLSPTLGTSQLQAGLLAGGIGLALVVLYSLLYYRGLGFVTIASLVVSGGLTYALLVILGREIGFTLTLAGIAGFVIAIGITADSFIVFFERIKDEVHGGRSIRVAVPRAWARARRTIISADVVSLLAAAVLYYFAAGEVKGFAFTLGLSTILDLAVVFLFTHPLVSLLSRSRAFGSARFTGLNSVRSGGIVPSPSVEENAGADRTGSAPVRRRAGATATVALLEPETEIDPGPGEDQIDAPVDGADPSAPSTEEPSAGAGEGLRGPRRSRVTRRAVPSEIGLDAAERAAARRGRTVRSSRGEIADEDRDAVEVDEADGEPVDRQPPDPKALLIKPAESGVVVDEPSDSIEPTEVEPTEVQPSEVEPARVERSKVKPAQPAGPVRSSAAGQP
nr:protein translocase subunit SecD [Actinomycetota bacterium]